MLPNIYTQGEDVIYVKSIITFVHGKIQMLIFILAVKF
jgi:hypothetical protein